MAVIGLVLGGSVVSAFVPGMPTGTWVGMTLAALVAAAAARVHERAEGLRLGGAIAAAPVRRVARFLDDLALALALLALLFAVRPF